MKKILLLLFTVIFFSCNNQKYCREFYPNGNLKLKIAINEDGIENGLFEEYYESGKLKIKGQYFRGQINDSVFVYHENGIVQQKGIFKNGHRQNWWKFFNNNGKLIKEEQYYEVRDSAYKNQRIQYDLNGKINYAKSSMFKFSIPDTITVGKNLMEKNIYYTDLKGDRNYHFLKIIVDNQYSKREIKKDTFVSDHIKKGKVNPWFGVFAYKKGSMKIKGKIQEEYLIYKDISKDSAEAKILTHEKYFEKLVFVK